MKNMTLRRRALMMAQKKSRIYEWHVGELLPDWLVPVTTYDSTVTVDQEGITLDSKNVNMWARAGIGLSETLQAKILGLPYFSITFEYTNAYSPSSNSSVNFSPMRNSYIYSQSFLEKPGGYTKVRASTIIDISNDWGSFVRTNGNITIISNNDGVNKFYKDGTLKYTETQGGYDSLIQGICWVQRGSTENSRAYMTITKIIIEI